LEEERNIMKKAEIVLPVIRVVSEKEVPYVEMKLEMEDETYAMMVKWGKEAASDDDFVNIAMREGIKERLESENNGQN
jgi:hypothetical protein